MGDYSATIIEGESRTFEEPHNRAFPEICDVVNVPSWVGLEVMGVFLKVYCNPPKDENLATGVYSFSVGVKDWMWGGVTTFNFTITVAPFTLPATLIRMWTAPDGQAYYQSDTKHVRWCNSTSFANIAAPSILPYALVFHGWVNVGEMWNNYRSLIYPPTYDNIIIHAGDTLYLRASWRYYTKVEFMPTESGTTGTTGIYESTLYSTMLETTSVQPITMPNCGYVHPSKDFKGWLKSGTSAPLIKPGTALNVKVGAETFFYASWVSSTFILYGKYIDLNGVEQEFTTSVSGKMNTPLTIQSNALQVPSKTGYNFYGWTESNVYSSTNPPEITNTVTMSVSQIGGTVRYTLYGIFSRKSKLNYNANGGTGTVASAIYFYYAYQNIVGISKTHTLSSNAFTYTGRDFMGWSNTNGLNNVVNYAPGQPILVEYGTTKTVYAKWSEGHGYVRLVFQNAKLDDGTDYGTTSLPQPILSPRTTYNNTVSFTNIPRCTWNNHELLAYYIVINGVKHYYSNVQYSVMGNVNSERYVQNTSIDIISTMQDDSVRDVVLYAVWSPPYADAILSYDPNGGVNPPNSQSVTWFDYNSWTASNKTTYYSHWVSSGWNKQSWNDFKIMYSVPILAGRVFEFWNTSNDSSGTTYNSGDTIDVQYGAIRVLYAIWATHTYKSIDDFKITLIDSDGLNYDIKDAVSNYKITGGCEQPIRQLQMIIPKLALESIIPQNVTIDEGETIIQIDAVSIGSFKVSKAKLNGTVYEIIAWGWEEELNYTPIGYDITNMTPKNAVKSIFENVISVKYPGVVDKTNGLLSPDNDADGIADSEIYTGTISVPANTPILTAMYICGLLDNRYVYIAEDKVYYVGFRDICEIGKNPLNPDSDGMINLFEEPDVSLVSSEDYRMYKRIQSYSVQTAEGTETLLNHQTVYDAQGNSSEYKCEASVNAYGEYMNKDIVLPITFSNPQDGLNRIVRVFVSRFKDPSPTLKFTVGECEQSGWSPTFPGDYAWAKTIKDDYNDLLLENIHQCDNTRTNDYLRLSLYTHNYPTMLSTYQFGVAKTTGLSQVIATLKK